MKAAAALQRRKERDAQARYVLEGPRFIADVLATAPDDVVEVFSTTPVPGRIATLARDAAVAITPVTTDVLSKIADSATPQGVVAVVRQRESSLPEVLGHGFVVVLHEVSDPGNAGAVVRTTVAAGGTGVVYTSGSVDPWHPKAVRAAAGTTAVSQLVTGVTIDDVLAACDRLGQRAVALDATATSSVFEPAVLSPPVALVFGSEAHGLPAGVLGAAKAVAAVPRYGPVESLNLAATVAISVYAAAQNADARRGDARFSAWERDPA